MNLFLPSQAFAWRTKRIDRHPMAQKMRVDVRFGEDGRPFDEGRDRFIVAEVVVSVVERLDGDECHFW